MLTVGDGLVTQIPALIVSTAAGLLVSKAGVTGAADKAMTKQLSGYPNALACSRRHGGDGVFAWHTDAAVPRARGGAGSLAYPIGKRRLAIAQASARKMIEETKVPPAEEPIASALKMDDLKIELGYALLPLVNAADGTDRLTDQIKALRRSLASEMGFVMPSVRILDNVQLDANSYLIKVKETEAGSGQIYANQYMVMDPTGGQVALPGHHTMEPTFGPAGDLGRGRPSRGCCNSRLHRRRRDHRPVDPPHGDPQGQYGRPALLCRGPKAPQGDAEGAG